MNNAGGGEWSNRACSLGCEIRHGCGHCEFAQIHKRRIVVDRLLQLSHDLVSQQLGERVQERQQLGLQFLKLLRIAHAINNSSGGHGGTHLRDIDLRLSWKPKKML